MYALKDTNGNITALSEAPQSVDDGWEEVPSDSVLWEHPNKAIIRQIIELEAQQTPRLVRETLAGVQFAIDKMASIETEIAALRSQLQ